MPRHAAQGSTAYATSTHTHTHAHRRELAALLLEDPDHRLRAAHAEALLQARLPLGWPPAALHAAIAEAGCLLSLEGVGDGSSNGSSGDRSWRAGVLRLDAKALRRAAAAAEARAAALAAAAADGATEDDRLEAAVLVAWPRAELGDDDDRLAAAVAGALLRERDAKGQLPRHTLHLADVGASLRAAAAGDARLAAALGPRSRDHQPPAAVGPAGASSRQAASGGSGGGIGSGSTGGGAAAAAAAARDAPAPRPRLGEFVAGERCARYLALGESAVRRGERVVALRADALLARLAEEEAAQRVEEQHGSLQEGSGSGAGAPLWTPPLGIGGGAWGSAGGSGVAAAVPLTPDGPPLVDVRPPVAVGGGGAPLYGGSLFGADGLAAAAGAAPPLGAAPFPLLGGGLGLGSLLGGFGDGGDAGADAAAAVAGDAPAVFGHGAPFGAPGAAAERVPHAIASVWGPPGASATPPVGSPAVGGASVLRHWPQHDAAAAAAAAAAASQAAAGDDPEQHACTDNDQAAAAATATAMWSLDDDGAAAGPPGTVVSRADAGGEGAADGVDDGGAGSAAQRQLTGWARVAAKTPVKGQQQQQQQQRGAGAPAAAPVPAPRSAPAPRDVPGGAPAAAAAAARPQQQRPLPLLRLHPAVRAEVERLLARLGGALRPEDFDAGVVVALNAKRCVDDAVEAVRRLAAHDLASVQCPAAYITHAVRHAPPAGAAGAAAAGVAGSAIAAGAGVAGSGSGGGGGGGAAAGSGGAAAAGTIAGSARVAAAAAAVPVPTKAVLHRCGPRVLRRVEEAVAGSAGQLSWAHFDFGVLRALSEISRISEDDACDEIDALRRADLRGLQHVPKFITKRLNDRLWQRRLKDGRRPAARA